MGGGQSTSLAVIDSTKQGVAFTYLKHLWHRNIIRMSPDQKKLYLSIIDLSPKSMLSFNLPRRINEDSDAPAAKRHSGNGGKFSMLPDGRGIVLQSGQFFQISQNPAADFKPANAVSPHISLATSINAKYLFVGTEKKEVKVYTYPDLNLESSFKLQGIPYRMAYDHSSGLLFCAVSKRISGLSLIHI